MNTTTANTAALRDARDLLAAATTTEARKAARQALNAAVAGAVVMGLDKHAVAGAAGIAYSTVNDIMRRLVALAPAIDPAEAWLSTEAYGFDLMDNGEAADARRSRTHADGEPCFFCGRKTTAVKGWWIHLATDGRLFRSDAPEAAWNNSHDQGSFLVGPECGRKIPAEYRSR